MAGDQTDRERKKKGEVREAREEETERERVQNVTILCCPTVCVSACRRILDRRVCGVGLLCCVKGRC